MIPTRAETRGRAVHWLVDLELGGGTYRLADEDLTVVSAAGRSLRYRQAPALKELRVTLSDGPLSVAITLPGVAPGGISWAMLVARGGAGVLTGARATLRRWFEGQTIERARVMISGAVVSPEYGRREEPFEFSIERVGDEVIGTIPPEDAKIDETTWPVQSGSTANTAQADPNVKGAYYPWIFGLPGDGADGLIFGQIPLSADATPAYIGSVYGVMAVGGVIDVGFPYSSLIIAGHEVLATSVRIHDVSGGYGRHSALQELFTVSTETDLRGRLVSVVLWGSHEIVNFLPGNEYWAAWITGYGGGLPNEDRTGPMRNAGEICEYMLKFVGERVDAGRMAATRTYLDRFHLDFCLMEPVRPRRWITEQLGSLLPLVWRESEDGIYLDVLRYDATASDAVLHLVESRDTASDDGVQVTRSTSVKAGDPSRVENDLTIRFAASRGTNLLRRRRLAAPGVAGRAGVADVSVEGEYPSWLLGVSQSRYQVVRPRTFDAWFVVEEATADLLLSIRALVMSICRRSLGVTGGFELEAVEPGSVVTYSEAGLHMTRAPALCRTVTLGLRDVGLEIELLDNPESP